MSTSQNSSFGEILFRVDSNSIEHFKTCKKIDEYLAYVGGFLQIALLGVGVVVNLYNHYDFCVHLANKLYIFDDHDDAVENM